VSRIIVWLGVKHRAVSPIFFAEAFAEGLGKRPVRILLLRSPNPQRPGHSCLAAVLPDLFSFGFPLTFLISSYLDCRAVEGPATSSLPDCEVIEGLSASVNEGGDQPGEWGSAPVNSSKSVGDPLPPYNRPSNPLYFPNSLFLTFLITSSQGLVPFQSIAGSSWFALRRAQK